jgi:hypothetical protein
MAKITNIYQTGEGEPMDLKINPEFKSIIPPLTEEEDSLLEESIKKGYNPAYPIIVCEGTIIDGHNRYERCKKYNIEFTISEMLFDSELDIKIWIIQNQFARRNLSKTDRMELAFLLAPMIEEKGKKNKKLAGELFGENHPKEVCQNSDKPLEDKNEIEPVDTKKELAKLAGVSHDTIAKYKKIKEKSPDETIKKVKSGEMSLKTKNYLEIYYKIIE